MGRDTEADSSSSDEDFGKWLASADGRASVESKAAIVKCRRLRRDVVRKLKNEYGGRCQVCGWSSQAEYGVDISQGHHLEGFLRSLDNSPSNLAILCPTHHSLIHTLNASFDSNGKAFTTADGLRLPLRVNKHL